MHFIADNFAPVMITGLIFFLILGFPVAFSLGAAGLFFGVLGVALLVPLLDALGRAQSAAQAFWLILAALVIVSGYTSINAVVKAQLFPVGIRALGVGLPYALAVSLFGGTAEYIALWFKSAGRESWFYWYVTGCIACSLAVYGAMRETRSTSRIDRDQGASMERMRS